MAVEFHQGQQVLVAEIDRLRQKAGEYDGKAYDEKLHEKYLDQMDKKWVHPEKHPANGVEVRDGQPVDAPPLQPRDLMELAEEPGGKV